MGRSECEGVEKDRSDKCDFYDPYPCACMCTHYDEYVEFITRCEHRTIKGKRVNDAANPLRMERLLRWYEVMFDGEPRSGIIIWGDGTMHDPITKKTICKDGTVIEDDHWGGDMANRRSSELLMEHMKKRIAVIDKKGKKNGTTKC